MITENNPLSLEEVDEGIAFHNRFLALFYSGEVEQVGVLVKEYIDSRIAPDVRRSFYDFAFEIADATNSEIAARVYNYFNKPFSLSGIVRNNQLSELFGAGVVLSSKEPKKVE